MVVVKICGITEVDHALIALEAGADLLGFVFAPSRRQLSVESAASIVERCRMRYPPEQRLWQAVGVFANQPIEFVLAAARDSHLDIVQISGHEPVDYCRQIPLPFYKTIHLFETSIATAQGQIPFGGDLVASRQLFQTIKNEYGATRLLLDSGSRDRWGGTGKAFHWEIVGLAARDCLVAGGLNPENVAEAIAAMQPWGVDVSSGVECDGKKNSRLIVRFIEEVRRVRCPK